MQDNNIILRVYGDSRSKTRYYDNVTVEDVWSEQLRLLIEKNTSPLGGGIYVADKSFGGINIIDVYKVYDNDFVYWGESKGHVFLFCGIVDCAPRPVPNFIRFLISLINNRIRKHIVSFIHKNRTKMLKIKYYHEINIKKFKKYYTKIVKHASINNEVYCIGIGPVAKEFLSRIYGMEKEMENYNNCIKEIVSQFDNCHYIDLNELLTKKIEENKNSDDEIFVGDGHHFSSIAHKYISEIFYNELKKHIEY